MRAPVLAEALRTGRELTAESEHPDPVRTVVVPLLNEPLCRTCHKRGGRFLGVIVAGHSQSGIRAEISSSNRFLLIFFSLLLAFVGGVLYIAVRKAVLDPLVLLRRGAKAIASGGSAPPIRMDRNDEFRDFAGALNEMSVRLREQHLGLESILGIRTAELNESVRLLRGILSSISTGIVLLDRDGRVRLINRQGCRILRCAYEEMIGRKLADDVPETAPFLRVHSGVHEEIELRAAGGPPTPIGFTSSPYPGGEGEQEGVIVVFQDLTAIKALRTELMNKERFAAMGRVVAGVAHEIRNPLFGISAIGQIFGRDLKDEKYQELTRALLTETKRLNHLVEELLVYGRPIKLNLEPCDLNRLWTELLDLNGDELARRGIRVVGEYRSRHPVALLDQSQIRQVFLNLIRNAMDAMPDGGTLRITQLLEDRFIVFRIADSGTGIPEEHRDRIFDLFFTTKPRGTGLGLAICKKIIQDHGGDIAVDGGAGAGAAFTVRIPYRAEQAPMERKADVEHLDRR